jgi:hypothetical protein
MSTPGTDDFAPTADEPIRGRLRRADKVMSAPPLGAPPQGAA